MDGDFLKKRVCELIQLFFPSELDANKKKIPTDVEGQREKKNLSDELGNPLQKKKKRSRMKKKG